jgi:hypothetical protein
MARTYSRKDWGTRKLHGCRKAKARRTGTRYGIVVRHFEEV